MPSVTYYKPRTNIQNDKELYELLVEINERSENELFIEHFIEVKKWLFNHTKIERFKIYWDIGNGEYQDIMTFELLDRQDILCYLLGILTGMDKSKNKESV